MQLHIIGWKRKTRAKKCFLNDQNGRELKQNYLAAVAEKKLGHKVIQEHDKKRSGKYEIRLCNWTSFVESPSFVKYV